MSLGKGIIIKISCHRKKKKSPGKPTDASAEFYLLFTKKKNCPGNLTDASVEIYILVKTKSVLPF